jgi:hypothetical protein
MISGDKAEDVKNRRRKDIKQNGMSAKAAETMRGGACLYAEDKLDDWFVGDVKGG